MKINIDRLPVRVMKGFQYPLAFLILFAAFQFNFLETASKFQFKTYRDGSEALVLGKIFADANGIDTERSNMGFVEKVSNTNGSNVLSVYKRIDHPGDVTPFNLTDSNWTRGFSNYENSFIVRVADVASIGYSSNELVKGQTLIFPDGTPRKVTNVVRSGDYLDVFYSGKRISAAKLEEPYLIKVKETRPYAYSPYPQQLGVQAVALSWLYRNISALNSVFALQVLMSLAAAIVLALLIREFSISLSKLYGFVFFVSMVGSPWVVAVARNLYWAAFLWFLPALFAAMIYRFESKSRLRTPLAFLFFLSIFIKCLAGYEYISTIMIFSLFPFIIDPFLPHPRFSLKVIGKHVFKLGCLAICGFAIALVVHAICIAGSVVVGLDQILGVDALKYSLLAPKGVAIGPNVSVGFVLSEYTSNWSTPVLFGFGGVGGFKVLLYLALISLSLQFYMKDKEFIRDIVLLLVTAAAPLSWFILLPRHSAIHVHLNFVLWYFGFIPSLCFVTIRGFAILALSLKASRGERLAVVPPPVN